MGHELLTWRERGRLWMRLGIRAVLLALFVLAVVKLLPPLLSLLAPFVAALLVAMALNPLVRWAQKKLGWSRKLLSFLILILIFALLGGGVTLLVYALGGEVVSLAQNWESLLEEGWQVVHQIEALFADFRSLLPQQLTMAFSDVSQSLMDWMQTTLTEGIPRAADYLTDKAVGVPTFVLALAVFIMGAYFHTADYPYLRTRCIQNMDESLRSFISEVKAVAVAAFGGYLRAQILLSAGVFFILLGGFLLIRQSYSLLLALGIAVLDFIPLLGSGAVMIPWAVVCLFTREYQKAIALAVIWGLVSLFRRMAEPKVVGNQTGLSPILSLVSIYAGMKLYGVAGMILGPIVTLVVLNLAGLGMFHNVRLDIEAAVADIAAILRQKPEGR